jgi:chloramphenicol 3-O phosphotransferase
MAQVIFLHGASSSGKTTLARALQARLPRPFLHLNIGQLRDSGALPLGRFRSGGFDWQAYRATFFDGFHRSVNGWLEAGQDVILEHILDTPGWDQALARAFEGHNVLFVRVDCPLDELIRREEARADRQIGSAERDFHTIHQGRSYDLAVDSTGPVDVSVDQILSALQGAAGKSDFI